MIEFGCGLTPLSFDRKLTLQVDTGADANAISKKTFNAVFPDVEFEESTYVLQNFDKRLIKPIGSFRCFLRWKGHKYRVKFEVMGIDTPNLLSRETTFLMGKMCLLMSRILPFQFQVQPQVIQDIQLLPRKEYFCHSVLPAEENTPCYSLMSMEDRSQMNCSSISDMSESPESTPNSVSGSNNHSTFNCRFASYSRKGGIYICRHIPRSW